MADNKQNELLTPMETAAMLRVTVHTLRVWHKAGLIRDVVRTPGGQRRFLKSEVDRLLGRVLGTAAILPLPSKEDIESFAFYLRYRPPPQTMSL